MEYLYNFYARLNASLVCSETPRGVIKHLPAPALCNECENAELTPAHLPSTSPDFCLLLKSPSTLALSRHTTILILHPTLSIAIAITIASWISIILCDFSSSLHPQYRSIDLLHHTPHCANLISPFVLYGLWVCRHSTYIHHHVYILRSILSANVTTVPPSWPHASNISSWCPIL